VVGDIHGQLPDLLTILSQSGFPSETNRYVFNGDFVDRGPNSVEVLLLLYCLKVSPVIPSELAFVMSNSIQVNESGLHPPQSWQSRA